AMKRIAMNLSPGRRTLGMVAATGTIAIVPAALAWACVGLVSLTTSSPTVQPGGTVTVFGKEFAQGAPVLIHLDSITGPVLATAPPPATTMTSQFSLPVPIPPDVPIGQHLLVATQDEHNMNGGNPARAVIYVGTTPPAPAPAAARPAKLAVESDPGAGALVLIALGVAVVSLLLVGLLMAVTSRRRPQAQAVKAS
ncbi:MAG: hypothetical protein DLM65_05030, partial [Candidatus Aeolococcus gillhamiae]